MHPTQEALEIARGNPAVLRNFLRECANCLEKTSQIGEEDARVVIREQIRKLRNAAKISEVVGVTETMQGHLI